MGNWWKKRVTSRGSPVTSNSNLQFTYTLNLMSRLLIETPNIKVFLKLLCAVS